MIIDSSIDIPFFVNVISKIRGDEAQNRENRYQYLIAYRGAVGVAETSDNG